jgi:hypothetical protein
MRIAREVPKLPARKAQRVADLSIRKAMLALSATTALINKLPPADIEKVFAEPNNEIVGAARRTAEHISIMQRNAKIMSDANERGQPPTMVIAAPLLPPRFSPEQIEALQMTEQQIADVIRWLMALHPEIEVQVICDMLNNVYCKIQDGGIAAEAAA